MGAPLPMGPGDFLPYWDPFRVKVLPPNIQAYQGLAFLVFWILMIIAGMKNRDG